jgi:hypothetical protein
LTPDRSCLTKVLRNGRVSPRLVDGLCLYNRTRRGQIGFVWRISSAADRGGRPNWLCLAESGVSLWVPSPRCPSSPKFGFVLHNRLFVGWASPPDVELASFRMIDSSRRSACLCSGGNLGSFRAFDRRRLRSFLRNRLADQFTITSFPSTTCRRIGFVSPSGASRRCRTIGSSLCWPPKLGLFGAFDPADAPRPFRSVRGRIGFVWRISPAVGKGTRPNWVCLAESGGPLWVRTNPQSSDWLCFAHFALRTGWGKLGLFVQRCSNRLLTTDYRLPPFGFVSRSGASRRCRTSFPRRGPALDLSGAGGHGAGVTPSPAKYWRFSL